MPWEGRHGMEARMTKPEHAATGAGITQCDLILIELIGHKNQWIAMPDLARISGGLNVHSRIADLRKRGHRIESKQERRQGTRKVWSYYRLTLDTATA